MSKPVNATPWSFSSLNSYETCPRRHYLIKVAKVVTEPPSDAMTFGNKVHKELELATKGEKGLSIGFQNYQPIVDKLRAIPGRKLIEYKFGLTKAFKPTSFFGSDVWVRGVFDYGSVHEKSAVVLDHKGLALDTPLPTPTGWTTMGDVKVGDKLIGSNGRPCTVTAKSSVKHIKCYEIEFDDGTRVVCDHEHLWLVNGEVLPVEKIAETLTKHGQKWRTVLNAAPVDLPDLDLPINPYVLGVWLGDGKHTTGEISKADNELWENISRCGYMIGSDTSGGAGRCRSSTVYGLVTQLRKCSLLKNKHVPDVFKRSSIEQRKALVRGLFDTDGSANEVRKTAVFVNTNERLIDDLHEILCSLGQRPHKARVNAKGFGKETVAWHLSFRPQPIGGEPFNPFTLSRKANRISPSWGTGNSHRRLIVDVREVPSVPTQCVAVDSSDHTYLCTRNFLVTHNTGSPKINIDQLKLFAGAALQLFPALETVKTGYLWLGHNKLDTETFNRGDESEIWADFSSRVYRMERSFESGDFPPKPSGLCKRHCPVGKKNCEFCGES